MYKNNGIIKSYYGSGAIAQYSIVKFGADDSTVSPAAASTDLLLGVANELGLSAADVSNGSTVDIVVDGIAELQLGAAVTRGQKLTSDGNGLGIPAAPAAGVNAQIVAIALRSGVLNDVIPVLVEQSVMQG
jgi:hypothetical protein